ncbi:hypothetical protein SAY86_000920 [Trapa natans]|uniref:cinnamyl-alcohol dehydrogenase n=1 Tax=Trapa natans TaxID=22666 RepID=A0AAN7MPW3_TRANT|nr:hypothetical protein SAY86_000920 [Trapa natans]
MSPELEHPQKAIGWAARVPCGVLSPFKFSGRATGDKDVKLKVLYCGICHTDIHNIRNDWGVTTFPVVPGHEIVGEVIEVGSGTEKTKVGDRVGMGCLIGSCGTCHSCLHHEENYCPDMVLTYGGRPYYDGSTTYGGYSDIMVVEERFTVLIPDSLPLAGAAPLLCAGITVYSPLRFHGLDKPGVHVGLVGLGGLGHVAVKFAKAMGARVTVISSSPEKREEALTRLGADSFLVSTDMSQIQAATGTLDGIIDTVSAVHSLLPLISLLKTRGKIIVVGAPDKPLQLPMLPMIFGAKGIYGSCVGGMKETQEMMDFAAKHNITTDIELVPMDYVNTALDRLAKGDVKYRFVIDVGNTL